MSDKAYTTDDVAEMQAVIYEMLYDGKPSLSIFDDIEQTERLRLAIIDCRHCVYAWMPYPPDYRGMRAGAYQPATGDESDGSTVRCRLRRFRGFRRLPFGCTAGERVRRCGECMYADNEDDTERTCYKAKLTVTTRSRACHHFEERPDDDY